MVIKGVLWKRRGPQYVSLMIRQICLDYSGLPDVRTLSLSEIKFFYDGLKPVLLKKDD